jgi:hypothetical protein
MRTCSLPRARGVKLTLVVAAAAWLATTTTARAQADYVLSNVSAVLNGTPVSISGSFINEGPLEYLANIQVTRSNLDLDGRRKSAGVIASIPNISGLPGLCG